MFDASTPFALFEDLRVPYRHDDGRPEEPVHRVTHGDTARRLFWPRDGVLQRDAPSPGMHLLRGVPLLGAVLPEAAAETLARRIGGRWEPTEPILRHDGSVASAILRADDGSVLLPFDPNELTVNLRAERYLGFGGRRAHSLVGAGRTAYYAVRPFLPRELQLRLRRSFAHLQRRRQFPRWPSESAVDDLYDVLLELVVDIAGTDVPSIAPWPQPWRWALVLTHDVEGPTGYELLDRLLEIELQLGYRSSWNFVPCNGYVVERRLLERLRRQGFEVGVHGLFHDGRDIAPGTFARRLPAIRAYAEHWQAVGFRSPGTLRSTELLPRLGFDYDSSFADTSPFEPQAGGCCTWFPFLLGDLVELPITVEQDHTVFDLLQHRDEALWLEKTTLVRDRGGMALVLTHPDYVVNPSMAHSYRRFLAHYADDESAWKALPRDVSAWWRRRLASRIVGGDGEWKVVGPAAAEARIELAAPERVTR